MHGGTNPGRPPSLGNRSKYHPARLGEKFRAALANEALTSLRDDIAFAEVLVAEAVEKADGAKGCPLCAEACRLYEDALAQRQDPGKASKTLAAMHSMLRAGREGEGLTAKLFRVQEHKRRLTATENKREDQQQQYMTAQQANILILAIVQLANECIHDQQERGRFAAALMALGGYGDSARNPGAA